MAAIIAYYTMVQATLQEGEVAEQLGALEEEEAKGQIAIEAKQAEIEKGKRGLEKQKISRKAARLKSAQRARIAASGVAAGSPLLAMVETAEEAAREKSIIDYEQAIADYNLGLRREQLLAKGRKAKFVGTQAKKLSRLRAGTSLLTGVERAGTIAATAA
jgi:hypothetical protein